MKDILLSRYFLIPAVLLLVGFGSYFSYRSYLNGGGTTTTGQNLVDTHARQAVFLTNGQVYFGYVSDPAGQIVTLKNIYYLKTVDANSSENTNVVDASGNNKVILVKFGNEVHGPNDIMHINRDQILFYEDMKSNSKINDMIKQMGG